MAIFTVARQNYSRLYRKTLHIIIVTLVLYSSTISANNLSIDSLWQEYHTTTNFAQKLPLLQSIAYQHQENTSIPDSILIIAKQARTLANQLGHSTAEVTSLNLIALGHLAKGDFNQAEEELNTAYNKSKTLEYADDLAISTALSKNIASIQKSTAHINNLLKLLALSLFLFLLVEAYYLKKFLKKAAIAPIEPVNENIPSSSHKIRENDFCREAVVTISHEINTPVSAIMGFSEMLMMPDISEKDRVVFLESVIESCHNLSIVMTSLVEYSWLLTNQLVAEKVVINVNELMRSIQKEYSEKAELKALDLDIQLFYTDNPVPYKVDYMRLHKILCALVDNAIKYTNDGRVLIGYELLYRQIIFFVKDTGIGVSKEERYHIFHRFHRAEKSKYDSHGAGLGLALCQELVSIMDGVIWVESEEGAGATFKVRLPFSVYVPPKRTV